jgi:phospholipid N-methyltransferase
MLDKEKIQAMKSQLKEGVKAIAVPQLFQTPVWLAEKMVYLAGLSVSSNEWIDVLEPSAGMGRIVDIIYRNLLGGGTIAVMELNTEMAYYLHSRYRHYSTINVKQGDFLEDTIYEKYDRIIMNPPFGNADDIKHIMKAYSLLKPNGRLVALCADGSRQHTKLMPMVDSWESLGVDVFKEEGTGVRVALIEISK